MIHKNKIEKFFEILAGLKMTTISGIFLAITIIVILLKIQTPIDPAFACIIISGTPIVYTAIKDLIKNHTVSSDLLVTLALIACLIIGQNFAAAEVAFIMAIGELLEVYTVNRAKKGLKNLINLTPQEGRKITKNNNKIKEEIININQIQLKDTLRVLPGEVIPVDGKIIQGNTSIDQSIMTGESLPVDKKVGDEVFCGTMNLYGSIDMEATSLGEDSSLQKLINMVKEAEENQAPTQRLVDQYAALIVPGALIIAILTYLFLGDIIRAVTVLVVFCPCALVLSTPTSIMAAVGQATKYGIIIKSGEALEKLGNTDTIAFDKTGTLTYGNLEVSDIIPINNKINQKELLQLTATAEKRSEHPLAKAIINFTKQQKIQINEPENFTMIPGKGVKTEINQQTIYCGSTTFLEENQIQIENKTKHILYKLTNEGKANILIADNKQILGIISLSDTIRENAKQIVQKLEELDTNVVLLTGDNTEAANYFSKQVGITDVHAGLLPEDKVKEIQQIKDKKQLVAMIGDGVNDAPALKTADISIAMAEVGSDVAIEAADVALISDDIQMIPYLKKLSNATIKNIHINICLAMALNIIALILSIIGILNPVTGALVHNIGSCLVIANAGLLYDKKFDQDIIPKNITKNSTITNLDLKTNDEDHLSISSIDK